MIHLMAIYKVKEEKVAEVEQAVTEFVSAVKDNEPDALVYEAFRGKDDLSFFHIMTFAGDAGEEAHRSTPHMAKFVKTLYPNCTEEPAFVELDLIGSNIR